MQSLEHRTLGTPLGRTPLPSSQDRKWMDSTSLWAVLHSRAIKPNHYNHDFLNFKERGASGKKPPSFQNERHYGPSNALYTKYHVTRIEASKWVTETSDDVCIDRAIQATHISSTNRKRQVAIWQRTEAPYTNPDLRSNPSYSTQSAVPGIASE